MSEININRIKVKDIPGLRSERALSQGNQCPICNVSLQGVVNCLDHNHKTGHIRSVLCLNCNGIEGKIFNLARRGKRSLDEPMFLKKILSYWDAWSNPAPSNPIHPKHKTKDEKRIARNKKARNKRKSKKSC
jgi:hypothetical protein